MARTTPGTGIPVPESPDPRTITADLWASFSKVGQLITQTSGESSAALVTAEQAETAAAQALARALLIEDPIHVGPNPPTEGEELWVDTDEDAPPTPVSVASEDITDATDVGRNVLTAPLTADGRRALNIWDGTRAHLDEGTDTAERTWEAKDLAEFVAARAGAASWDDLTGKPETFPPSVHTHPQSEVTGLAARLDTIDTLLAAVTWASGPRSVGHLMTGVVSGLVTVGRIGPTVTFVLRDVVLDSTASGVIWTIPPGFRPTTQMIWTNNVEFRATGPRFIFNSSGSLNVVALPVGVPLYGKFSYDTLNPIPTTLPGDPT